MTEKMSSKSSSSSLGVQGDLSFVSHSHTSILMNSSSNIHQQQSDTHDLSDMLNEPFVRLNVSTFNKSNQKSIIKQFKSNSILLLNSKGPEEYSPMQTSFSNTENKRRHTTSFQNLHQERIENESINQFIDSDIIKSFEILASTKSLDVNDVTHWDKLLSFDPLNLPLSIQDSKYLNAAILQYSHLTSMSILIS